MTPQGQKNQVQVKKYQQSNANNESFLYDANHFNKKHKPQPQQPQRQAYEHRKEP